MYKKKLIVTYNGQLSISSIYAIIVFLIKYAMN